jgi:hypothetical protein
MLERDNLWLELLLNVIQLEADHWLDEHLFHELFLTISGLHLELGHGDALGQEDQCAVVVLLIGNEDFALQAQLNVDRAAQLREALGVNDDLETDVADNVEVSVSINANWGWCCASTEALFNKSLSAVQNDINGLIFTVLLLEWGNCNADGGSGEHLFERLEAGVEW